MIRRRLKAYVTLADVVEVLGERATIQFVNAELTRVLIDGHVIGALYPPEPGSLLKRVCTIDLASSHLTDDEYAEIRTRRA
jgi:hypothetical protein